MNEFIQRHVRWALAVLLGLSALSLLMSDKVSYLVGILAGFVIVLLIGVRTGAFRSAPKG